ncbi:MAG: pseudouridine synthase [Blautia sp.]|jgi:16S rRNA pseudouridine516 synthase
MAKEIRLDKYLSEMGIGTRSQIKNFLKKRQVTVGGVLAVKPEQKIRPGEDIICFDGQVISYTPLVYYMFHKPAGCVTATKDASEKTVLDFLPNVRRKDLFPVGRLDKDTEGLLLITNDGELAHQLLSPKKHVPKTYYAKIDGQVLPAHIQKFQEGIDIGDPSPTLPSQLQILSSGPTSEILLTITEGRYHQVKRMFEAIGCKVTYLKRQSMGGLPLDETLAPGSFRPLTAEELKLLRL